MCGVIGVLLAEGASATAAAADIHDALFILQHRGQDACGISTSDVTGRVYQCKGNGMASRVFADGARLYDLPG